MAEPVYLTAKQLVERWGGTVAKATLATWRCHGKGPHFTKLGGRVVYSLDDVQAYEAQQRK